MTLHSLPLFHRIAGQPVILLGEGDAAKAKQRLIERAGGKIVRDMAEGIDAGARLAFIAHDNPDMAQGDAIRLRCAGLLVNVVDRSELCDFTTPSILDRDPVLIAVGTGGASAGLAKILRLRLERLLPQGLGALTKALEDAREGMRARWASVADRRRALDAALDESGELDLFRAGSEAKVRDWLTSGAEGQSGRFEIVLISNDPEDLTLRAARLLGQADVVVYDAGVAAEILSRARADAVRVLAEGEVPEGGIVVVLRLG
ncbi:bifunctional precorrin-2 dehydrogenase/sirohydrochlorin ferrochelatase [Novosphingobium sp. CECT 9465]|uniref:precorrin-2 dehydrogenase/sirohydrochlorin ferrochelatase family protein n=1 Tax=Novosphingobium sp. CECT 9465 TaxID=2829794 RepID=UPI001E51C119|nr:NAD(P)-dependent oxidoreductase [Novosphingobium sp. CECT 9465]CAH0495703.1 Siroheme synthase [Novosphingobium sp. CECT 9465]